MKNLVAAILLLVTFTAHGEEVLLKVRAYNSLNEGTRISLANVIDTKNLAIETIEKLKSIVLGDAPKLGEKRVFTNRAIAEAVRGNLSSRAWDIQIPHRVVVENRGHEVAREAVEEELISKWKKQCEECEFTIQSLQLPVLPPNLTFANWAIEYDGRLPKGSFSHRMRFSGVDGRPIYFWISGQMSARKKVPVLTRNVPQNGRIGRDDYRLELRDISFLNDGPALDAEILTSQTRYVMNAGDILLKNSLQRERAVRRGEVVRVTVGEQNWKISLQAVTEQDGYVGDTVNVRNPQTNKVITGRVIAAGEVEVRE